MSEGPSGPGVSAEDATLEGSHIAARPSFDEGDLQGQVVAHYAVVSRLGSGGMGVVYAGYDPRLDRRVALKVLHARDRVDAGSEGHARLLREAQALAQLQHPNVITIHDVGEHHGQVFIAMEFVDGVTLAAWQTEEPRDWSVALSVYLRAGEGLAAAHDQGLVHRDFKPENVMLTLDGAKVSRVQVLDFGLARATDARAPSGEGGPEFDRLSSNITQAGRVMGTPAYMAPEQHLGEEVGPAADQFSLCVSLYEALYGQRPFEWSSALELASAVLDGRVREPPRGHPAPRRLWSVLQRGLTPDPGDRWPSMRALLHELRGDPARARRRWVVPAIAAGIGGCLYGAVSVLEAQRLANCRADADQIESSWNDERRVSVRTALLANERPYAERTAERALPKLDRYAQAWREARARVCAVVGPQDAEQRACLDEHRAQFEELVADLEDADDRAVMRATTAASLLPRLEECERAESNQVAAGVLDPEASRALRAKLGHARALLSTGRYEDARDEARDVVEGAVEAADARLEIRARMTLSEALARSGAPKEASAEDEAAMYVAGTKGFDTLAAQAATKLAFRVGYTEARHDEASALLAMSEAWLDAAEVDEGDLRRADILDARGIIALRKGDTEAAKRDLAAAHDLRLPLLGRDHPTLANSLTRLGAAAMQQSDSETALAALERAEELRRESLGEQHPDYASALANLAGATFEARSKERAIEMLERSIAIREAAFGARHPSLTTALGNLAMWQGLRGDYAAAASNASKAYQIVQGIHGPRHINTAHALLRVAEAHRNPDPARALEVLEQALEIQLAVLGPDHFELAMSRKTHGEILLRLGRNAEALAEFEEAARIESADETTNLDAALCLLISTTMTRLGRPLDSVAVLERGIDLCTGGRCDSVVASLYTNLAFAHIMAGDGAAAAEAANRSAKKRASRGEVPTTIARLNAGVAAWMQGDRASASRIYATLIDECDRGTDGDAASCRATRRWLAEFLLEDGRNEEARNHLEKARALRSEGLASRAIDIPFVDFHLARALVATGGDRAKARALAEGARDWLADAGPGWTDEIARIDAWLRQHPTPP